MTLSERIDVIEAGYEFMLAYSAQGRDTDRGVGGSGFELREFLAKMESALDNLGAEVVVAAGEQESELDSSSAFFDAVDADARKVQGIIRLVMAQPDISSRLIENAHIATHFRALLTDLFVIAEAFKPRVAG